MSALTARAGYNRCTFYQYFESLDDILDATEREFIGRLLDERGRFSIYDASFIEELSGLYEENELYFDALFGDYGRPHFIRALKARMPRRFDTMSFPDDEYLPYRLEYRLNGGVSLFRLWLDRGKDIPLEDLIRFAKESYGTE